MIRESYICTSCRKEHSAPLKPVGLCTCGKPLEVHFSWNSMDRESSIDFSDDSLWRYASLLPEISSQSKVSLGEGFTPLMSIENEWDIGLYIKDETVNPTGSFKDRGMALAVSMAKKQGVRAICLPSAGNAGVAAAAYCEEAGIECHVFLPETIPENFLNETKRHGASVYLQGDSIAEAGTNMMSKKREDWFDISTLKEPYRVEGKKTMGYEMTEQLGWEFPDAVIYPAGGGTGLIGMWKAFNEMKRLGWVSGKLPRMAAVQSSGCAPVVKAFDAQKRDTEFWDSDSTEALGLNVPGPIGGHWMLRVLEESQGTAISVSEDEIKEATAQLNKKANLNASYEAGVVWLGLKQLVSDSWINPGDAVVIPITGVER